MQKQKTKRLRIVSNTHWDREFRRSFEKTRHALLRMMDTTLDILEGDPDYPSFTMDGHAIMIDDYLALRPERRPQVERMIRQGRLVVGPYYTLVEEFSVSAEALVRNLLFGRKTVEKYGGSRGSVAYTPSSWGQTGQLPQILRDFGLTRMMFYRGISHHESDAEFVWQAPDGSQVLASRFALYARYNYYYQVFRAVTQGQDFDKTYDWRNADDTPLRMADGQAGQDPSFDLKKPEIKYDRERLRQAFEEMLEREAGHFTTDIFLAMMGHDISVAHPLETQIVKDAREIFAGVYDIKHTSLEEYWHELTAALDFERLQTLVGERRSYLKEGMWTFLFPGTISARTYLKQQDFAASRKLTCQAEPLACLAALLAGVDYPAAYLERGWRYLLANHTHDANGGCAPDPVCQDMEYRYRKVSDIADLVVEDALSGVAANLSRQGLASGDSLLVVYNPLPFERDVVSLVDLEVPAGESPVAAVSLHHECDSEVERQPRQAGSSSVFVDSIWDVPTILPSHRVVMLARFSRLPALGWRAYRIAPERAELRTNQTLVTGVNSMANQWIAVRVNGNGTVDLTNRQTGTTYCALNYLSDEGEAGNAWEHVSPSFDQKFSSLGASASIAVVESGPLRSVIRADYRFAVPSEYAEGGRRRSERLVELPVSILYTVEATSPYLAIRLTVDNRAGDHWLRANFPTGIETDRTWADSHFDIVSRPIAIPDSRGWVEEARGTHPLRSFVEMNNGREGIALFTRGLFEYEALRDRDQTLALTLIRACRIKLKVSEEKTTELDDAGVQCPGRQTFEYALYPHSGDCHEGETMKTAIQYQTPVRAVQSGRGKGQLPHENWLFRIDNPRVAVTAVKRSEDGEATVVRFFNPCDHPETVRLMFSRSLEGVRYCGMDETAGEKARADGEQLTVEVAPRKIVSLRVCLAASGPSSKGKP